MKSVFAYNEIQLFWIKHNKSLKPLFRNGFLLAILAAFASSSKSVLVKLIFLQEQVAPLTLLTLRLSIAFPFFILLVVFFGKNAERPLHKVDLKIYALVCWLGFNGFYFASLTDFIGLTYISASLERLVLFSYPTLVLLIESIWKKQLPSRQLLIGVGICYTGLLAVFGYDLSTTENTYELWMGVTWVFASGLSFALFYIGANTVMKQLGSRRFIGIAGAVATIFTVVHFLSVDNVETLMALSLNTWLLAGLMAILCTIIPSLLLASAITKIGASTTASVGTLGPVITICLAWLLLGETLSLVQWSGVALVVFGINKMR